MEVMDNLMDANGSNTFRIKDSPYILGYLVVS